MTESDRERIKLLANGLNTAGTSCFTVGIATPIAGYLYNVGGLRRLVERPELALGFLGFLYGCDLTYSGKAGFEGPRRLNEYAVFAFVVVPAVVVILAYAAVLLHERSLRRGRRSPAE